MTWIRHSLLRYEKYRWQAGNKQQKRTKMKKILLVATIIFSLNVCLFAQKQENFNHIGLYTMRIGKIEAIVISDGHLCV